MVDNKTEDVAVEQEAPAVVEKPVAEAKPAKAAEASADSTVDYWANAWANRGV